MWICIEIFKLILNFHAVEMSEGYKLHGGAYSGERGGLVVKKFE